MVQTEGVIENFSAEDKQAAAQTRKNLLTVLDQVQANQKKLESDFVRIGTMIEEIRSKKYWLLWGHRSFNNFLESVESKVDKGRSRLYACAGIARDLLPYVASQELADIGITKASAIASAVKKSGRKPSDKLLNAAAQKGTTVQQVQELIAEDYGLREEQEMGVWMSLSGVFYSPEEREEFDRAVSIACRVDPALPHIFKWNEGTAGERKEVLTRWVREFIATWGPEVERGA